MHARLMGVRVLVTRAAAQAEETCAEIAGRGAHPIRMPLIALEPVEDLSPLAQALRAPRPGWLLLTSVNAVSALARVVAEDASLEGALSRWRLGAVGPQTASRIREMGIGNVRVARDHRAEGLLAALPEDLAGVRVLLPGARTIRAVLPVGLRARGARVERLVVYDNVLPPPSVWAPGLDALRGGAVDAVLLTSGSTARHLRQVLGDEAATVLARVVVAAIGPVTAADAAAAGLRVDVVADPYTLPALLDALEAYLDKIG